VEAGCLTERELGFCLSEELGIPQLHLGPDMVDPDLVLQFPGEVLRQRRMVPILESEGEITVAMADPLDRDAVRDLERVSPYRVRPAVAEGSRIDRVLEAILGPEDHGPDSWGETILRILTDAFTIAATEIHVEPVRAGLRIRRRARGRLEEAELHPPESLIPLIGRLRALARIPEDAGPGQGRFRVNLGGVGVDIHVSILPTPQGDSAVMLFGRSWRFPALLSGWPFEPRLHEGVRRALERPGGLVIVNAPDEDRRRALAYAMLAELDPGRNKILTLERHAFRRVPEWTQVEEGDLPVADPDHALELLLKQRPDGLLLEGPADWALPTALPAVLQGMRVILDMPYVDAADVLLHLRSLDLPPPLLDRTVRMVISVASLPGLCPECRRPVEEDEEGDPGYESTGCAACDMTGESDEVLVPGLFAPDTGSLRRILREADGSSLLTMIGRSGQPTIRRTARRYVRMGRVSSAAARELL
jgi:type II secretory ATPase GspE/PulE/Tfp pilus assembly ATPase PilB-like protein